MRRANSLTPLGVGREAPLRPPLLRAQRTPGLSIIARALRTTAAADRPDGGCKSRPRPMPSAERSSRRPDSCSSQASIRLAADTCAVNAFHFTQRPHPSAGGTELLDLGQDHRQIALVHRHDAVFRAIDDPYWRTPVSLAGYQPIVLAQRVLGLARAPLTPLLSPRLRPKTAQGRDGARSP